MKWFTIGILLNFLFTAPVLSELTKADLQAIRTIVKEEIAESEARTDLKLQLLTTRIDEMDKRLTASIANVDKRLTASIANVDKRLTASITDVDKRLTSGISSMEKQLGFLQNLLLVLIAAVIGVPGIFIYFERRATKGNTESQEEDSSRFQEIFAYMRGR